MVGISLSLILDENRRGLADQPFGVGKPYIAASVLIGLILFVLMLLRVALVSHPIELVLGMIAVAAPFIILFVFRTAHTKVAL